MTCYYIYCFCAVEIINYYIIATKNSSFRISFITLFGIVSPNVWLACSVSFVTFIFHLEVIDEYKC